MTQTKDYLREEIEIIECTLPDINDLIYSICILFLFCNLCWVDLNRSWLVIVSLKSMSSTASLSIGGMTCGTCSSAIEKLLTSLKGIDTVLCLYKSSIAR